MFACTNLVKRCYLSAIEDTLFLAETKQINLKTFRNLQSGRKTIPVINTPYIYTGGKYSIFGLHHIEDYHLSVQR